MRKAKVSAVICSVMVIVFARAMDAQIDYSKIDTRTARDIAVNTMGALWTIGSDPASATGIQRLVGSALVTQPGTAVRIAVDPSGNPWIVNEVGNVYHWEKTGTAPATWVQSPLKAMDIGVGRSGAVWAVGVDHRIMKLDNGTWTAISGAGDRIAVDIAGNPWVVNSGHNIWHWNGTAWDAIPGKAQDIAVAPDNTVFIVGETQRPGGFQILRYASKAWVEVPGAAGIAVAATRTTLSVAQLPGSQVVNVNVPLYAAPPVGANQPITIAVEPGTAIAVSPPSTSPTAASVVPPTPAGSAVRRLFFRDRIDEARMLQAIKFGGWGDRVFLNGEYPLASSLSTLERAFAHMAMIAAEAFYNNQPQMMPDQALSAIGNVSNPNTRRSINTILATMMIAKMYDRSTDAETLALRDWSTKVWRVHKVSGAKATLGEYQKWKQDPCGYEGKPQTQCQTLSELFTTRTPPEHTFASKSLNAMFASNGGEIGATAGLVAGGLGAAVSSAVLASTLGLQVIPANFVANTPAVVSSLLGTFGSKAGSVGALGAAGIGGAIASAAILAIVVGTTEGFKVVNAMRVEPMLMAQLGKSMTHPIIIENELDSDAAKELFLLTFLNAAANRFNIPKNTVDGEIRFYNQGGYVARMNVRYRLDGTMRSFSTKNLSVGAEETISIPAIAQDPEVTIQWFNGSGWLDLTKYSLAGPTYTGFTSYGTGFNPSVKNEYPEIATIQQLVPERVLTVTHGGGYVARIRVSWVVNGKTFVALNRELLAGFRQMFFIPSDATNIYMEAFAATGWVGEPWKAAFVKTWPSPPSECVKIYGTTLDPKWNNECN